MSYHVSLCGIGSKIGSIGLDHDRITGEISIPDVREGTSTRREVPKDLYIPRLQLVTTGWQGRLSLLDVVRMSWPRALVD